MRRMAKWEEMARRGGEEKGEKRRKEEKRRGEEKRGRKEKKSWRAVALTEMLIDVVNTMKNEPILSPFINYKHTHQRMQTHTRTHTKPCASVKRCVWTS